MLDARGLAAIKQQTSANRRHGRTGGNRPLLCPLCPEQALAPADGQPGHLRCRQCGHTFEITAR